MKALTLTQPWATLVAIGAKKIETRSWRTDYRGPLAIHAAKGFPAKFRNLVNWSAEEPFASVLKGVLWESRPAVMVWHGQEIPGTRYIEYPDRLHLGCVIATCQLIYCVEIQNHRPSYGSRAVKNGDRTDFFIKEFDIPPDEPEFSFGDYTPGRYAWILADIKPLPQPLPAKGSLRLWDWDGQP
jgi:activating signal cointegrator 1